MNLVEHIAIFLDKYGALGMFVGGTVALWWKLLIPGWVLTEQTAELRKQLAESETRLTQMKAERDELLRYHFRGLRVFSKVVAGREITPKPGILPDGEEDE